MVSRAGSRRTALVLAALLALALPAAAQAAKKQTPIAVLVDRITGADLHAATLATQDALARAGVATREGKRTYRKAVKPPASSKATRYETINLALDARDQAIGGRVTLAQFGQTLAAMKAFKLRGRDPAVALRDFMTTWVNGARRKAKRAHSFAPLLLAEMARRQTPPLDLAAGDYDPNTLRFSLLEMDVIVAAFDRFPPRARHKRKVRRKAARAQAGPANCTEVLKEYIGKVVPGYDQIEASAISTLAGEAIASAIGKLMTGKNVKDAKAVFNANKEAVGGILSILNTLMRIQKLAALYAGVQIYVDVPTPEIEKPEAQQNYPAGAAQYGDGIFTANVGLSPDAEKSYRDEVDSLGASFRRVRKAIADCAGVVGIPVPAFADDVAEDLTNFKVKWTLDASNQTANYEFKKTQWFAPGGRLGSLTRVDETLATHVFHVDIPTQPRWSHAPDKHYQVSSDAYATAELITAQPPSLGTLINGMLGPLAPFGLVDALVELSLGWFQSLKTPSDTALLTVTEHKPKCVPFQLATTTRARAAQTPDQCTGKYTGTFTGTADLKTGPAPVDAVATFSGSMTVAPLPNFLPPEFGPPPSTQWSFESGTAHFKIVGTTNGCTLLAEGPVDLGADPGSTSMSPLSATNSAPRTYTLRLPPPLTVTVPGTLSQCPDPASDKAIDWPVATGVAAFIFSPMDAPVGPSGELSGSNSGKPDPSTPEQTWTWDFRPE
jgi:hypothetical protein